MRCDRWSRARLDDHIVMSRCEAASDRVRGRRVRPYIGHNEDDNLSTIAKHSAPPVIEFASRGDELDVRTPHPPIREETAGVTPDVECVVGRVNTRCTRTRIDDLHVAQRFVEQL